MDDYMYLQQMRFGQRIKYMCDVDKECMDELVPAFVLQPLIENAIIHGLSSSSKGGLIYVRCFKKEDKMWLSVADTGIGIERDKLKISEDILIIYFYHRIPNRLQLLKMTIKVMRITE